MKNFGTKREFESDMEDEDCMDHELAQPDKKRRLRSEQVKWLERSFEAERKLEPDRKVKLAIEIGPYPRQVAIWFQNHRARWKTKQLERDFNTLQSAYDDLKQHHKAVKCDNETLIEQIGEIKAKMVRDAPLGLSFNCETNVASSDNEEVSMHYDVVSSCGIPINEGAWSREIWPHPYSSWLLRNPVQCSTGTAQIRGIKIVNLHNS